MKKWFICFLTLALMFCSFPATILAAVEETFSSDKDTVIIYQETALQPDGSILKLQVTEHLSRGNNIKEGSKTLTHLSNNGELLWEATLTARFYYDGTTCYCINGWLSLQFTDNSFYEVSRSVSNVGATATANFTIGHRVLGVTVSQTPYTLTLTCDKYGNLS